ncbi:hypothetical protein AVEN_168641-1 [Araneus ventricosus]|uniref:Uncharacterized protein n=1 Tax=Araneus ventricosus TaxID=182803 RepID=A0A4Y2JAT2_ARAVE|nr:hypothetical protein AVEN_168641-1 [Araneus ventricosus]
MFAWCKLNLTSRIKLTPAGTALKFGEGVPAQVPSYFSFMTEHAKWKTNDFGSPNLSTTTIQFSSDIHTDEGLQMVWNSAIVVNVHFHCVESLACKHASHTVTCCFSTICW